LARIRFGEVRHLHRTPRAIIQVELEGGTPMGVAGAFFRMKASCSGIPMRKLERLPFWDAIFEANPKAQQY